jgi:membrane-associated phospholipid phosphatase
LWTASYARFRHFTATFLTLTGLTLTTYALFPAMPPWMAGETVGPHGETYLPFVERVTSHTLVTSGIPTIHSAVQQGEAYANPVAAVPSFHAAVPLLVLLVFWPALHRLGRTLLVAYVLGMAFTLVYGGEHYVVDVLLGWAYAGASVAAVALVLRVRRRRRENAVDPPPRVAQDA